MNQVGFNHIPNASDEISTTNSTMKTVLHKSDSRGKADHGWLLSRHTFSFANYHNPDRMNFGVLRVLNDDVVSGGKGFGRHPHDNMEIISIPLEGGLQHKDSMDNIAVIKQGDVQVMSAGTGVYHSEFNNDQAQPVKFLQIWMFPNKKNVAPRYDQIALESSHLRNNLSQILSPFKDDDGVWVYQDAWFHMGNFDEGKSTTYAWKKKGNGLYLFVLKGNVSVGEQELDTRDGYGIWGTDSISIQASCDAQILLMEVPMTIS